MATSSVPATAGARAPASAAARFWHSTVGKKIVMAASGLVMAGFLVTHMSANLLVFAGPDQINRYSRFLHETPELLWPARVILLASLVLHVVAAAQLTGRSRSARPVKYAKHDPQAATIASRTIRWGGVLILLFVVFHILHFTTGTIHPTPIESGAVYANAYDAFEKWWILAIYLGAVGLVGLHFFHGLWSATQTTGVDNPDRNWFWRQLATVTTIGVVAGFAVVPVLFFAGALPEPVPSTESAQR